MFVFDVHNHILCIRPSIRNKNNVCNAFTLLTQFEVYRFELFVDLIKLQTALQSYFETSFPLNSL
jgi:hypothetical protein